MSETFSIHVIKVPDAAQPLQGPSVNSVQLLPTPTKSRRTCAQQNAHSSSPFFTGVMAL